MILIGILLILVAVGGGAFLFTGTSSLTDKIDVTVLGITVSLPPLSLAVAGALVVLCLWFGWAVLRVGAKRSSRQRKEAKEQARVAKETQVSQERQWAADRAQSDQGPTST